MTLGVHNAKRDYQHVIASFADPEAERLFRGHHSRRLPPDIQRCAHGKLVVLHAATSLQDLRSPPSNRLEALKGGRAGQHSIRIYDTCRICCRWEATNAIDVEIVDYH